MSKYKERLIKQINEHEEILRVVKEETISEEFENLSYSEKVKKWWFIIRLQNYIDYLNKKLTSNDY
jgi:hypothetical protein